MNEKVRNIKKLSRSKNLDQRKKKGKGHAGLQNN